MRLFTLFMALISQPSPAPLFDLQNPNNLPFDQVKAEQIYISAVAEVALTINPKDPPGLQPVVIVKLGDGKGYKVSMQNGVSTIQMEKWEPTAFAKAMVFAASYAVLSQNQIKTLAERVALQVADTVDVRELQKKK